MFHSADRKGLEILLKKRTGKVKTVDHKILSNKLDAFRTKGTEIKWFGSYLNERSQFCRVDGHNSKIMRVPNGVPQGSSSIHSRSK